MYKRQMINNIKTLSSLNEGSSGRVAELKINGSMRRRLQDIGLIEGTEVLCLQKSPSGDPVAYLIRGAVDVYKRQPLTIL